MQFNQYCLNVGPTYSPLAQHWNSIGWLSRFWWDCRITMPVTLSYPVAKNTVPREDDTLAQCWCNAGPPYSNLSPLSSKHEFINEYNIFPTLFKNATIWPSDTKRYIWSTCSWELFLIKVNRFHTRHHVSANKDTNIITINLIGSWPGLATFHRFFVSKQGISRVVLSEAVDLLYLKKTWWWLRAISAPRSGKCP